MKQEYKLGKDLIVGDLVDVWWNTGDDINGRHVAMVYKIEPYDGPLAYLWAPEKARIGTFTGNVNGRNSRIGMTIEPHERFCYYGNDMTKKSPGVFVIPE